jgi:tetratricopeptide (TPR) repeat protein/transcriptional regulator with XRE-family HTH domain
VCPGTAFPPGDAAQPEQGRSGTGPFGVALRQRRVGARLTQEQLAARAGLSARAVSDIERGRVRYPRPESVRLLGCALGLTGLELDRFRALARAAYWAGRDEGQEADGDGSGRQPDLPAVDPLNATRCHDPGRIPAQLPLDVRGFTGRNRELAGLDALLDATTGSNSVVIAAIVGTAGVGKTALAVRWAHRVADRFGDGQLYLDLRGYDPDRPMSSGDALAALLGDLGVRGADLPHDVAARASQYRTLLAGRRVLLVLDNARDTEQIRLLLPGTGSCVVVTSRDCLAGLVARHGAWRVELDLLPEGEAVDLLRLLVGDRVAVEPYAATSLADHCARLPLALRVAAEFAVARPAASLATLAVELAREQRRLDVLDAGGDPRTAVRAVFSWSYRHLPTEACRVHRSLGLHPDHDSDVYALAALTGTGLAPLRGLLDQLCRAHLVQQTRPGRYGTHDLLRVYAAEQARLEDTERDRQAAMTRLLDHYRCTAAAAVDTLFPGSSHRRPRVKPSGSPVPAVHEPPEARAWLDTERANLVAAAVHAATRGWPAHAVDLSAILTSYLDTGSHYTEAVTIHTHALHAARCTGDRRGEAAALCSLGLVQWRWGRYPRAADHHEVALALARKTGDRGIQARALNNLGLICWQQGRYQQAAEHLRRALALVRTVGRPCDQASALDNLGEVYQQWGKYQEAYYHFQQALAIARAEGDVVGEAAACNNVGTLCRRWGCLDEARDHHERALALAREAGHLVVEATALNNLGLIHQRDGRLDQAHDHHRRALALCRETGYRADEADALDNLGILYRRRGQFDQAIDHHERALALARDIGYRQVETSTLNSLGETHQAAGRPTAAGVAHQTALALADEAGDRYQQARAHDGIAQAMHATGQGRDARRHWQEARIGYAELRVPEAERVQALLAALDEHSASL